MPADLQTPYDPHMSHVAPKPHDGHFMPDLCLSRVDTAR